ncbi:oxidoreductase [Oceanobacillus arenosus]|uniref:Oxidoreductase n=1 Tax=Oceanobacillus arenosus TaxID=1229153 RepID=A0A3D8Q2S3_9BACI|nr:Gfo/Idh/MocA family oxidoreductase [Oceanobacillus arenosus]RDW21385.1 oxidoreductase [Oceanobacillus arenosus]
MNKVRIGIIGLGFIGCRHAVSLANNAIPGAELTAVYDRNQDKEQWVKENLGENVKLFTDEEQFFNSNMIDGVIIATPHPFHTEIAIQAFKHDLHVLVEKPAGVYTKEVRLMNEAAVASGKVFSMMFNQRLNPLFIKLRELISSGELGEITRTTWIITNWFRAQSYYDSAGWRATWAGEGGGVLINQDPHQLDLWQWVIGMMPKRVRAFCKFGKYHNIEVEDDVTAYVEYENGATGLFVTSTGEAPGTNRLEINGDLGKIVVEDGKITLWRLSVPASEFSKTFKGNSFDQPEIRKIDIPVEGDTDAHNWDGIITNWVDAIANGTELIASGEEGIKSLMLSNSMLLSTWTDNWVNLPIDEDLFHEHLQKQINNSKTQINV